MGALNGGRSRVWPARQDEGVQVLEIVRCWLALSSRMNYHAESSMVNQMDDCPVMSGDVTMDYDIGQAIIALSAMTCSSPRATVMLDGNQEMLR